LETYNKTNEYRFSDSDSKIRYQVMNDNKNLHIILNTSEYKTITKIVNSGLKIYFDIKGKKSEKVYFQYPTLGRRQQPTAQDIMDLGNSKLKKPDLNKLIAKIPDKAIFNHDGDIEQLRVSLSNSDFKVSIKAIKETEIVYDLIIPFNKISKGGVVSLSKLSIGISSDVDEPFMGGGPDGGPGGGPDGGGPGPGGPGGGGPDGGPGGFSSMAAPVFFWFKVVLH
jgi:hypothetical protein